MLTIQNYINSQLVVPNSGEYFDNTSPVDGKIYSQIPNSDYTDIDNAVSAAKNAFKAWSELSKKERHDHIMHLADEIENHSENSFERLQSRFARYLKYYCLPVVSHLPAG